MKPMKIIVLAGLIIASIVAISEGGWLIYHKPAFQGKVIDAETKEPLEGVVVVVTYNKAVMGFGHGGTAILDVRETLTNKDGTFRIPSYTTIISPLALESWTNFIIFKPGYGSFPYSHVSPPKVGIDPEDFFSKGEIGTQGVMVWKGIGTKFDVTFGVVELPKLKTRVEREKNISSISPMPNEFLENQKNLIRLIHEEEESLGLQKTDPFKTREFIMKQGR